MLPLCHLGERPSVGSPRHRRAHTSAIGQCRKRDGSGGGTIFDAQFAQDALDVLADRPGGCAQDDADLIVRLTLGDPNQNLRFTRGEPQ